MVVTYCGGLLIAWTMLVMFALLSPVQAINNPPQYVTTIKPGKTYAAEVATNGFNIAVSSYVEAEETREAVDITRLNAEIARIVCLQAEFREQIDQIVSDLASDVA